jgi:phosphatidylglycerophosphatase A
MTFPVCMIGLPLSPLMLVIAFVTSRICDIVKPAPARGLQRLKSGLGIVIDDVIANVYCLAINHAIYWALVKYGVAAGVL